ncbi:4Fe-4S dicluster domain-containing protein [Thermus altitudinis]|uniref:4Fe-4S dicluster domain-containing protein n=1 Tax=Thermus altitudinis TaxID=2908145 RepID=UPI001FA9CB74|nr:4Fe-4S dicluster domain-containing protein [Thermus altitudinis]
MPNPKDFAILFDASRCIGCKACQVACKQWNDLEAENTKNYGSYANPPKLTAHTWISMRFYEGLRPNGDPYFDFIRVACMHCTNAPCVGACPVGAMAHREGGVVTVDERTCIGCRACVQACPYGAVHFDEAHGVVQKCTMCYDRIAHGDRPACVKACPTDALTFGSYGEIRAMAEERVRVLKERGHARANVYGLGELGGTHVLYVLTDHPSQYDLPKAVREAEKRAAAGWLSTGIAAAVLGAGLKFLVERREALKGGGQ